MKAEDVPIYQLIQIAETAVKVVKNPAYAGICDEDIELEEALRKAGLI